MENKTPDRLPVPQVPIRETDKPLFASINAFVYNYMSKYDNSHDYNHILRVLSNTHHIRMCEYAPVEYDLTALYLAALLHDVGDHKYAKPGEEIDNQIRDTLLSHGADPALAEKVQTIVKNVSYTHEVRNPGAVNKMLTLHPELAIVQDADRLDAIGAVGIARCFSFGAAKMPGQPMERAVGHFGEKLYKLQEMMKTETGKAMAGERHAVLLEFERQWRREVELKFVME